MSFMRRAALQFAAQKAARRVVKEILPVGVDNLKVIAESGRSIVGTYLNGCSKEKKKELRSELAVALNLGVTIDMIIDAVARQIPELEPIIKNKESYRKTEIERVMDFVKEV